MLRTSASGPEVGLPGRTEIGPPVGRRPAGGPREDRFRCLPGGSPAQIRPGRPIFGPEALMRNTE